MELLAVNKLMQDLLDVNTITNSECDQARELSIAIVRSLEKQLQAALNGAKLRGAPVLAIDEIDLSQLKGWRVRGNDRSAKLRLDSDGTSPRFLVLTEKGQLVTAYIHDYGATYHLSLLIDQFISVYDGQSLIDLLMDILPDIIERAKSAHQKYSNLTVLYGRAKKALEG